MLGTFIQSVVSILPATIPILGINLFQGKEATQMMYPGTKWCGPGHGAKNYTELGYYRNTDLCCRAHDHCNVTIRPNETKFHYKNTKLWRLSNCECEEVFFDCMKGATKIEPIPAE